jgi:hypothetical protein
VRRFVISTLLKSLFEPTKLIKARAIILVSRFFYRSQSGTPVMSSVVPQHYWQASCPDFGDSIVGFDRLEKLQFRAVFR